MLYVGWTVHNNVVDTAGTGIIIGGGRNNTVYNNHFYNIAKWPVSFDNRGLTWQSHACTINGTLMTDLRSFNYTRPPWSVAYPALVNITHERLCVPQYNVLYNNSWCNATLGAFVNNVDANITEWNSTFYNNYYSCK